MRPLESIEEADVSCPVRDEYLSTAKIGPGERVELSAETWEREWPRLSEAIKVALVRDLWAKVSELEDALRKLSPVMSVEDSDIDVL